MPSQVLIRRLLLLGATAMLAACSDPPMAEMQGARAALSAAKDAGAEVYAPDVYGKAQESMAQAKAELDAQAGKFRLLRSYGRARQLIVKLKADSEKARLDAAEAKAQARQDAQAAIDAAKSALTDAAGALTQTPGGKDAKSDNAAMRADLQALRGLESDAESAFASESYDTARQRASQVRQQAMSISADIAAARAKAHRA